MSGTRNYFVESGAAASVLAVSDYGGVPLAQEQKELTPLQRLVILKEAERQQEEAEREAQQQQGQTAIPNSAASGSPMGNASGETIEFVNENA